MDKYEYCRYRKLFLDSTSTMAIVLVLLPEQNKIRQPQQSGPWQGCDDLTRIHTLRKYVGQAEAQTSVELVIAKQL